MRKTLKIISIVLLSLLGFVLVIAILININGVQNFLIKKVTSRLSNTLHTEVSIRHVDFKLFNKMVVEDALVKDQQGDTLLFAGQLNVRITDFFFLKTNPVLHYVGLTNAVINLKRNRNDSIWNYQFIENAFSSPSSSPKTKNSFQFDIQTVELQNVHLNKTDAWAGEDMLVGVNSLLLKTKKLSFGKHSIDIASLIINQPVFSLADYTGGEPDDSASSALSLNNNIAKDSLQWNTGNWKLHIENFKINDGIFTLDKKDIPHGPAHFFDAAHIYVNHINATFENTQVIKDSIISNITLSAKEQSGIEIQRLKSRFKLSPLTMEFAQLDLLTNKSHIQNYYSMRFSDFSDMSDYITKVRMKADFKNSTISSDDIAFFAPSLSSWNMQIEATGEASGTVNNLSAQNLHIDAGSATHLIGNIRMRGLPDINETFIDFTTKELVTNNRDLKKFFPSIDKKLPINMQALNVIHFNGSYTGFINDFVAYGNFTTNIGGIHSDLNMKVGRHHNVPVYSGNLSGNQLDLGALFDIPYLGKSTFKAKVDGEGFDLNTLQAKLDAHFEELTLNNYAYHNIETNGEFNRKLFSGTLNVQDPNAALSFNGTIDLNPKVPVFNFTAQINKSNLYALNFTNDSITFKGTLDLNFEGNSIDNFSGYARLHDVNLYKNKVRIAFDSLNIHSGRDSTGTYKLITLQGNEMQGYLKGNFNTHALPQVVKLFLHQYYPSYVSAPDEKIPDENFSFAFTFGHVDPFLRALTKNFSGLNNATISGGINTHTDTLQLAADVPVFGYRNYRFNNIHLNSYGTLHNLSLQSDIQGVFINDSLWFPNSHISLHSSHDTSLISLRTSVPKALASTDLYARVVTLQNGYLVNILHSAILINNKEWDISPGNEITITNNNVRVKDFNMSQNQQHISLTYDPQDTARFSFLLNVKNLILSDFLRLLPPSDVRAEGIVSGSIHVNDLTGNTQLQTNLSATQFRFNDDSIGTVSLKGSYSKASGLIPYAFQSPHLQMSGTIGTNENNKQLSGEINMDAEDISVLQPYISNYVTNVKGYATGKLTLAGTTSKPLATGNIRLDSVGVNVVYLGTHYTFNNETFHFTDNAIDVGTITLRDVDNNMALITGAINHTNFNDLNFDLNVRTNKFQFLNTTYDDNQQYYGDVIASGSVHFYGPLTNMQMAVNIAPAGNSHIHLPIGQTNSLESYDFITFKKYGKEITQAPKKNKNVNLTVRLNAEMNPLAHMDVILDPATGDAIRAVGNGVLTMNIPLNGNITLYGTYVIERGTYYFTFQRLIPKNFEINSGSSITWNGSPYDANINVTAVYHVPGGASLYELLAGEAQGNALLQSDQDLQRRQKVDVDLKLTGQLKKPDINFSIELPEQGIASGYAATRLQQITQDQNQLLNQVFGLLIAGQFIPSTSSNNSANLIRYGGLSSVGAIISAQGTAQLNNLLGRLVKDKSLGVNINYNPYSAASNDLGDPLERNALSLGLTKSFLHNRLRVEVGSMWDWGRSSVTNQQAYTTYFDPIGDFQLEYLLTPDGHIRLSVFRRSDYNALLSSLNRTIYGGGISYKREFDKIMENFRNEKKQQAKADSIRRAKFLQQAAADSIRIKIDSAQIIRNDTIKNNERK